MPQVQIRRRRVETGLDRNGRPVLSLSTSSASNQKLVGSRA